MGFKRRKKNYRNYNQKKKDGFHPKRAISGAILLAIAIGAVLYVPAGNILGNFVLLGAIMAMCIAGTLLLLFSPNRKGQDKISRGIGKVGGGIGNALAKSMEGGKCCRCTNCGRDHNHWTHRSDPDDFWD